jgi:hypothetical protein
VQNLSSDTGATTVLALGGTPGTPALTSPNSLACCVTWKIDRHYRGGHPRSYIGPVSNAFMENQTTFTSAFVGTMLTSANAFRTAVNSIAISGGSAELVAVHRVRSGAQLAVPLISPITTAAVDSRVDTMRRRLGRDR